MTLHWSRSRLQGWGGRGGGGQLLPGEGGQVEPVEQVA